MILQYNQGNVVQMEHQQNLPHRLVWMHFQIDQHCTQIYTLIMPRIHEIYFYVAAEHMHNFHNNQKILKYKKIDFGLLNLKHCINVQSFPNK